MKVRPSKAWLSSLLVLVCGSMFSGILAPSPAHGINVELQISISNGLLLADGTTTLPLNSVVYVIGTSATIPDLSFTNSSPISAEAVGANELLLGTIRIDNILGGGTFFPQSVGLVDISTYDNVYLRFFDYQDTTPISGSNIAWGVSTVVSNVFNEGFGFAEANFPGGDQIQFTNTFVVIPEPGTFHLLLLAALLLFLLGGTGMGRKALCRLRDG